MVFGNKRIADRNKIRLIIALYFCVKRTLSLFFRSEYFRLLTAESLREKAEERFAYRLDRKRHGKHGQRYENRYQNTLRYYVKDRENTLFRKKFFHSFLVPFRKIGNVVRRANHVERVARNSTGDVFIKSSVSHCSMFLLENFLSNGLYRSFFLSSAAKKRFTLEERFLATDSETPRSSAI